MYLIDLIVHIIDSDIFLKAWLYRNHTEPRITFPCMSLNIHISKTIYMKSHTS